MLHNLWEEFSRNVDSDDYDHCEEITQYIKQVEIWQAHTTEVTKNQSSSTYIQKAQSLYDLRMKYYPVQGTMDAMLAEKVIDFSQKLYDTAIDPDPVHINEVHRMLELIRTQWKATQFYAALGITDIPIYGLATAGQNGTIGSAWYCSSTETTYVVQSCLQQYIYDMTNDSHILQYLIFLFKLRPKAALIQERYQQASTKLSAQALLASAQYAWTLRAQLVKHGLKTESQIDKEAKERRKGRDQLT
ncbi:hypothetical protein C8Q70DRAFT_937886 [Cubamyces menziesii]|nr:hypothetical protein C8Q70DRAFT_937886 [Cubamyces menziesii]